MVVLPYQKGNKVKTGSKLWIGLWSVVFVIMAVKVGGVHWFFSTVCVCRVSQQNETSHK